MVLVWWVSHTRFVAREGKRHRRKQSTRFPPKKMPLRKPHMEKTSQFYLPIFLDTTICAVANCTMSKKGKWPVNVTHPFFLARSLAHKSPFPSSPLFPSFLSSFPSLPIPSLPSLSTLPPLSLPPFPSLLRKDGGFETAA